MNNSNEQLKFAQWVLERNLGWVAAAEIKAGFIVAIDSAMLGVLASSYNSDKLLEHTSFSCWSSAWASLLLAIGVFCAAMTVFPRVNGPISSNIFFGNICKKGVKDFEREFLSTSLEQFLSDCVAQVHRNSEIANHKFRWVRTSMICSIIAVIPWLLALSSLVEV